MNKKDVEEEYGYIIDYKDLFHNLEGAIKDYTSGALDGFDKEDVENLLTNRLEKAKINLEAARESIKILCEPVTRPRDTVDYLHYFCAKDTSDQYSLKENEPKRVALYKVTATLLRAYAAIANEMKKAGYSDKEFEEIKEEVTHYEQVCAEVKMGSGDMIDMKLYEPAMRHLLDTYIRAEDSRKISAFDDLGLIDMIVEQGTEETMEKVPPKLRKNEEAMAETIENNLRKIIIDEQPINPRYYEKMSELLDDLIKERRTKAKDYEKYLRKIKDLATKVKKPEGNEHYPPSMDTAPLRAFYDNLKHDEALVIRLDSAIRQSKQDSWRGNRFKERALRNIIREELGDPTDDELDTVFELVKAQSDY